MSDLAAITQPLTPKSRVNLDWTRDGYPDELLSDHQRFIRNVDWTKSPLGPMNQWPDQLRQMVMTVVADPVPAAVYWGDAQVIVYNEAIIPLIESKHPHIMGQDPRLGGFAELWDQFDSIILEGERTGKTHIMADGLVYMTRRGFLEECYYSYRFIPVVGPEGHVVASYSIVSESTVAVISKRRAEFTRSLAKQLLLGKDLSTTLNRFIQTVEKNDDDIIFGLQYTKATNVGDPPTEQCTYMLENSTTPTGSHAFAPPVVSLSTCEGLGAAMCKAKETREPVFLSVADGSLPDSAFNSVPWRDSSICINTISVWPIIFSLEVSAFLVLGLTPRLSLDEQFSQWLYRIVQETLAHRLSIISLEEEQSNRALLAAEAQTEKAHFFNRLREEKKFSTFAERTSVGLCVTNMNGEIMYANESWYNFSGLNPKETNQTSWLSSVVEDDVPVLEAAWIAVTAEKRSFTFQCRSKQPFHGFSEQIGEMRAPNRIGYCVAYPELDEDNNVISVMGIIVDISELKWTEAQVHRRTHELEASEQKYRQFAEHAPVGLLRMSLSGEVDFVNQSWMEFFDLQPVHGVRLPFLEVIHPDDREMSEQLHETMCANLEPITREIRLCRQWTQPGYDAPPQPVVLLVSGHAELGSDGKPTSLVWWCTDITQMKAATNAIADKMDEAMRQKAQQEAFIDMISHEIRNPMSAIMSSAEEILHSFNIQEDCASHYYSASPKIQPSQITDSGVDLDVDPYRNAIDAAQTIMHCIEYQKHIVDDVLLLSKLEADMLDLAPISTRPMIVVRHAMNIFDREFKSLGIDTLVTEDSSLTEHELDWAILDPRKFLQIIMNLLTNAIDSVREANVKQISLNISASESLPPQSDEIDYFAPVQKPNTQQSPSVSGIRPQTQLKHLMIKVLDTGKGLTPAERMNLMNVASSAKTLVRYGDAGLGLFIARRIVGMMNGQIGLVKDVSHGNMLMFYVETRATIRGTSTEAEYQKKPPSNLAALAMPTRDSPAQSSADTRRQNIFSESTNNRSYHAQRSIRVLLVEDNLLNQKVACKQLRNHGYQVFTANHGLEALDSLNKDLAEDAYFDIVLCDIEMPIMNGIDCIKAIRRGEVEGSLRGHIPILAVTANARSEQVKMALDAGSDGVVTKPYRIAQLIAEIEKYTFR